jgi:hypothetical protein
VSQLCTRVRAASELQDGAAAHNEPGVRLELESLHRQGPRWWGKQPPTPWGLLCVSPR